MPAYQVEGVTQLPGCWVSGVMAESELVIVHHQAAGGGAVHIGVAVFQWGRIIAVLQDAFHQVGDGVGATEGTHDPSLFQRVFGLAQGLAYMRFDWSSGRPERSVMPVSIGAEDFIRSDELTGDVVENELAILRRGGPVHQASCFKGSRIEAGKRQHIGQPAGNRSVLVRRDISVQRDDHTVAGLLWRVAVGGVQSISVRERQFEIGAELSVTVIAVQAHQTAIDNGGVIALAVLQVTADKAADVLDGIAFGLGQMSKLSN